MTTTLSSEHIALFHSSVQLVHTHTHTHNRVTNYSFTSFSNRDVFKYPGQTLLLACNKPCISVYTGGGGVEEGETLQIDFLRESSESFQFAFPLVRQMRQGGVVNYALT